MVTMLKNKCSVWKRNNFLHSDITVIILQGQILILYNWRPYLSITPRIIITYTIRQYHCTQTFGFVCITFGTIYPYVYEKLRAHQWHGGSRCISQTQAAKYCQMNSIRNTKPIPQASKEQHRQLLGNTRAPSSHIPRKNKQNSRVLCR